MTETSPLWVYMATKPLLWLALTLCVYTLAQALSHRLGKHPFANPVLWSVVALCALLLFSHTPYNVYFEGAQFIHVLIGPATVALALPIWENRNVLRKTWRPLLIALVVGSIVATGSVLTLAWALELPHDVMLSLAPKSVTAGIAMGISEQIGGLPALTASFVILTGVIGAVLAAPLFDWLGIKDMAARGLGIGLAAHGIGTARAFQVNSIAGTYASLAMAINGLMTAFAAPLLLLWLGGK